jgi:fatty acid desaturase
MTDAGMGSRPAPAAAEREAKLERARRRVAEIKGFYIHLVIFALVVGGLFVVNLLVGGPWWVAWVLFGWGIGVIAHGIAVLVHGSRLVADWEERKIKQLMGEG